MRRLVRRACGSLAASVQVIALSAAWTAVAPQRAGAVIRCGPAPYGVQYDAPGRGKTVALTFDDGPGRLTGQLLQLLADSHVEATFFNIGGEENRLPRVVAREYRMGFALGGHTWNHLDLPLYGAAEQAATIDRQRVRESAITGAYPCLFRPPYGDYDSTTLDLARRRGMSVWYWSVDTEDWKATGSADAYWVDRIASRANAGSVLRHPVILFHNTPGGNPATIAALPRVIRHYRSLGYRFVDLYGHSGHPAVRRISPTSGQPGGGTRVTILGNNFVGVRAVRFGSTAGTSIRVVSSTELTVTSPRHDLGRVNVRVVTTFGTSPKVTADVFRFVRPLPPPVLDSLRPASGPTSGGTVVGIMGQGFGTVTAVRFGSLLGTGLHVTSDETLYVIAPPHAAGTVDIRLVSPNGTSPLVAADRFTYVAPGSG
jgi:peptidoglycan/xylan/chitin deacetylase (PgdA/CDA1 family)